MIILDLTLVGIGCEIIFGGFHIFIVLVQARKDGVVNEHRPYEETCLLVLEAKGKKLSNLIINGVSMVDCMIFLEDNKGKMFAIKTLDGQMISRIKTILAQNT